MGVQREAPPHSVGCVIQEGKTPLIAAAKAGDAKMVKLLLDAGANPHLKLKVCVPLAVCRRRCV